MSGDHTENLKLSCILFLTIIRSITISQWFHLHSAHFSPPPSFQFKTHYLLPGLLAFTLRILSCIYQGKVIEFFFFNANLIMPLASLFSLNICLLNFKNIYIFNNLHDLELSSPSASLISSWDKFSPHSLSFFLVKISPIPQVLHSYPLLTRFCPSIKKKFFSTIIF